MDTNINPQFQNVPPQFQSVPPQAQNAGPQFQNQSYQQYQNNNQLNNQLGGQEPQAIGGLDCGVTNCHYNQGGGKCCAKQVRVGPQYANTSADTICDTFKPQNSLKNTVM